MPFYEYECSNCKFYVEALQKVSDPPLIKCPSCGEQTMQRLISAPVFRLKGSGWYETDFKSEKEAKRNLAEGDAPAEPASTDSDDKAKAPIKVKKPAISKAAKKSAAKPAKSVKTASKPAQKATGKKAGKKVSKKKSAQKRGKPAAKPAVRAVKKALKKVAKKTAKKAPKKAPKKAVQKAAKKRAPARKK